MVPVPGQRPFHTQKFLLKRRRAGFVPALSQGFEEPLQILLSLSKINAQRRIPGLKQGRTEAQLLFCKDRRGFGAHRMDDRIILAVFDQKGLPFDRKMQFRKHAPHQLPVGMGRQHQFLHGIRKRRSFQKDPPDQRPSHSCDDDRGGTGQFLLQFFRDARALLGADPVCGSRFRDVRPRPPRTSAMGTKP